MDEEELMEQIRNDRIQMQRTEILKVQQDAFQKHEKYWMQYQEVGNVSSKRTADKYELLGKICSLALQELSSTCTRCERRRRNGYNAIKQLHERQQLGENSISVDEVVNLIEELYILAIGGEPNEDNASCRPADERGKILPNLLQRSSGGGYYS